MATNIEQILGRDINSLKELREEIKRLQDSIANIDPTTQQFKDTAEKLSAAQEQLTSVTRAGKDGMDVAKDSIVGMEREYRNLYNTYKTLSEEQRNSDFGKGMAEQLNTLSTKLNETKKNVGNFKDNIGRYAESAIEAFTKMGGSVGGLVGPFANATKGVMGFNTALKANPIGAVITLVMGLVNLLKSLSSGIKGNEESQMRLNQAMAAFQPIIDAASNAMDRMGQVIVSVIEFVGKLVNGIRLAGAAFTDFIGITKGAKKEMKEQQKTYADLAKSQNQLTIARREAQKLNAADQAEVETLREQASATSDATEKRELLLQAKAKQEEINNRNIEIAKEELRVLEVQASLTANDAAMNDKLAAAVAKVSQAQATAANNARAFNKQLNGGSSSLGGLTTATKNYREEAKKLYDELIENNKSEVQKIQEKYQEEKKLLEKYHLDTTLLTKKYEKDMQDLMNKAVEEQAKKRSEIRKREKEDSENEWASLGADIVNEMEKETTDIALKKLKSVKAFVDGLISQYADALGENEAKANRLMEILQKLDEEGFQALEKDFPDLADAINELNDKFGITITTSHSLDNAIESTKKRLRELNDEAAQIRLDEKFKDSQYALTSELLSALEGSESNFSVIAANATYENLQAQKSALEEELTNTQITYDKKLEILEQYYEVSAQLRQADWDAEALMAERTQNVWNDALDFQSQVGPALSSISSMIEANIDAKEKEGQITKQQADSQKKDLIGLQKVIQTVNLISVAANTAAGIMGVWKAYALEKVANAETAAATGPAAAATLAALNAKSLISAILQTTSLATQGVAQMAAIRAGTIGKISSLKGEGGNGGSAGTAAQPQEIDSTPYTYTRTLQTAEEEDALNRPVWVSVTDINNAQNQVRVRDEESSF